MGIKVMVNGLPGNMASEVVRAAAENSDFDLVPFSCTGPEIEADTCVSAGITFQLIRPEARDTRIREVTASHAPFITIDYSHPSAVNANAAFYCEHSLPFIMGTTGGDRKNLDTLMETALMPAVIAPNMAKQIVGIQMMLEYASEHFPGLFSGYTMHLSESHQQGKADTSGTAKAMVGYFNRMGVPFGVEDIEMVRDPAVQTGQWNIPAANLQGHAYHTYALTSADGTVDVEIRHNVRGRRIYALGTLDAVRFLQRKIAEKARGRFTMLDVLSAGAMK